MISIIVPAYNAERFIERTIASITSQSYAEKEIIVVDDGSTDSTPAILDRLAAEIGDLRIFHIPNGGAYAARLYGVRQARGEWIGFVDSDDKMRPDAIQSLHSLIRSDIDIVVGTLNIDNRTTYVHRVNGEVTPEEYASALLMGGTSVGNYGKLIRRSLFEGAPVVSRHIVQNEDLLLMLHLALCSRKIFVAADLVVYDYIFRNDSISKSVRSPLSTWFDLFQLVESQVAPYPALKDSFVNFRLHRLYDSVILNRTPIRNDDSRVMALKEESVGAVLDDMSERCLKLLSSPSARYFAGVMYQTRGVLRRIYHKITGR